VEQMHREWLLDKTIPKEEANREYRQETGKQEEREKSESCSGSSLQALSQTGQKERTEGVKGVDRSLWVGHDCLLLLLLFHFVFSHEKS
jgi:hypothetical protein